MLKYFVSWYLHNKENDGWAYKVVNKYDTLDKAKKQYYAELYKRNADIMHAL